VTEPDDYKRIFQPALDMPPADLNAEEMVLGALLYEPGRIMELSGRLDPEDFYSAAHQAVYRVIRDLFLAGAPYDPVAVTLEIERRKMLSMVGGRDRIAYLMQTVNSGVNGITYADRVKDRAMARKLLHAAFDIQRAAFDGTDSDEILRVAQMEVSAVASPRADSETEQITKTLTTSLSSVFKGERKTTGISTGLTELDAITGGLKPGKLLVIGARTSVGKTALAHQIACHTGLSGYPTVFMSMEMDADEMALRMLARESGIDMRRIDEARDLSNPEVETLDTIRMSIAETVPLWVRVPSKPPTPLEAAAWVRKEVLSRKARVLVIDYLGLLDVTGSAGKGATRAQEIGVATKALKAVALETKTTILLLAQINRQSEARDGMVPRLSDLRDSGDIEQDCDSAWLLHYPYRVDKSKPQDLIELIVAKNRGGQAGETVKLKWHGPTVKFSDWGGGFK
jgi:replicative DNA helicase